MILQGNKVAKLRNDILKDKIKNLKTTKRPGLAIILVGENVASKIYVSKKIKTAHKVGINARLYNFNSLSFQEIKKLILKLNKDKKTDGIIIQLPLPNNLKDKTLEILNLVSPKKDVDGFSSFNQGLLFQGKSNLMSATPKGVLNLLNYYNITLKGINALVIGKSLIVGKPMAMALLNENATVSICSKDTKNLSEYTKKADLIVSATGIHNLITEPMVKKDCILLDVGFTRKENKVIGDLAFESLKSKAKFITPVPGGIGPMTVNALLENTFCVFLENKKIKLED